MQNKKIKLNKGYVLTYDFENIKVHNYTTNDYVDDQVILLEKNNKLVVIESPILYTNSEELESYIKSLNADISGVLLPYHMGGGQFLKSAPKLGTKHSDKYGHSGGGKDLIDNFKSSFGDEMDGTIHNITNYIEEGKLTLADIEMNIIPSSEGFDIEVPEINSIYTHMLGSDCHSIIAGTDHAKAMIETLKSYIQKDYNLILTSHYIPETIDAVKTKISYLETIIDIAGKCTNAKEMIEQVKQKYPNYSGLNYLEMSANMFFQE